MGTSKLTEAARVQLAPILTAWCLIVEHMAHPKTLIDIEFVLSAGIKSYSTVGDYRQWDRWKNKGQLPEIDEFKTLNDLAKKNGWMQNGLGNCLVNAYIARRGKHPSVDACSGWDKIAAVSICEEYAIANNLEALATHCEKWRLDVYGPEESDTAAIEDWLDKSDAYAGLVEKEGLIEEIQIVLFDAVTLSFIAGVDKPYKLIKRCLNNLIKLPDDLHARPAESKVHEENNLDETLNLQIANILKEAIKLSLLINKQHPYSEIKACLKDVKRSWPDIKKILVQEDEQRKAGKVFRTIQR